MENKADYSNDLIFGKNKLTKVVSVEPWEDKLVVFREDKGKITYQEIDNKYWLLTSSRISQKQKELAGNQTYKYLAEFDSIEEQRKVRGIVKQNKIEYWDIFSPKEASMMYHGITYFKDLHPKDVSVLFWDIETTGLVHNEYSKVLLISNTFRSSTGKVTKKLFAYDDYKNQKQLIDAWCNWVREMDPTIFAGHNIYGFDLPYMRFVAKQNRTYLRLGRDDKPIKFDPYTSKYRLDGTQDLDYFNVHIFGREVVDTMFLARKYDFGKKYESYGLKAIVKHEGLEKKDRVFYDAGEIRNNYKNPTEWAKIKAYAIDDADDTMSIYDLMISSYFYVSQSVSKPFQSIINGATGAQINNVMVRSYFQLGHSIAKADEAFSYQGATSFGIPGIYKNGFKVDVASLYPSIMRQYKIYNPKKDPNRHFLEMIEYFTEQRLKNKKLAKETGIQYYNDLQESQKVFINSAYGALGASGLNYNYIPGADEVTRRGREVLSISVKFATSKPIDYWKELSEHE